MVIKNAPMKGEKTNIIRDYPHTAAHAVQRISKQFDAQQARIVSLQLTKREQDFLWKKVSQKTTQSADDILHFVRTLSDCIGALEAMEIPQPTGQEPVIKREIPGLTELSLPTEVLVEPPKSPSPRRAPLPDPNPFQEVSKKKRSLVKPSNTAPNTRPSSANSRPGSAQGNLTPATASQPTSGRRTSVSPNSSRRSPKPLLGVGGVKRTSSSPSPDRRRKTFSVDSSKIKGNKKPTSRRASSVGGTHSPTASDVQTPPSPDLGVIIGDGVMVAGTLESTPSSLQPSPRPSSAPILPEDAPVATPSPPRTRSASQTKPEPLVHSSPKKPPKPHTEASTTAQTAQLFNTTVLETANGELKTNQLFPSFNKLSPRSNFDRIRETLGGLKGIAAILSALQDYHSKTMSQDQCIQTEYTGRSRYAQTATCQRTDRYIQAVEESSSAVTDPVTTPAPRPEAFRTKDCQTPSDWLREEIDAAAMAARELTMEECSQKHKRDLFDLEDLLRRRRRKKIIGQVSDSESEGDSDESLERRFPIFRKPVVITVGSNEYSVSDPRSLKAVAKQLHQEYKRLNGDLKRREEEVERLSHGKKRADDTVTRLEEDKRRLLDENNNLMQKVHELRAQFEEPQHIMHQRQTASMGLDNQRLRNEVHMLEQELVVTQRHLETERIECSRVQAENLQLRRVLISNGLTPAGVGTVTAPGMLSAGTAFQQTSAMDPGLGGLYTGAGTHLSARTLGAGLLPTVRQSYQDGFNASGSVGSGNGSGGGVVGAGGVVG
eukprot:Rmarinus@m.3981